MKKYGVLNAELARQIAALGHREIFMIGDAGMPIPAGVPIIDLAVTKGIPSFRQVMDAVLEETEIEGFTLAEEIKTSNTALQKYIEDKLVGKEECFVSHEELKQQSAGAKFAIRTGEFTPYPNVLLKAGVVF